MFAVSLPFLFSALGLLVVVLFFLLRPLLRSQQTTAASRQALNSAIYREQLRELESDLAAGQLTESAYSEAERELQRRLLAESEEAAAPSAPEPPAGRNTALALLLILPLASAGLYVWLGNPAALNPATSQQAATQNMEKMVEALAARLEKNPDDLQGWAMLARSYKALRRLDEAEKAFARLGEALHRDPDLLASYADLLAARANSLEGRPRQLVEQALKLDPEHSMALSLAGTAAYQRQDFAQAVHYWQRLVKTLPPDSDEAKGVAAVVERLSREHKLGGPAKASAEKAAGGALRGRVELGNPAIQATPTDTVFILARPAGGGGMPLAAKRITVADLPYEFTLDDSLAMLSGSKLSQADKVVVEARLSRSGNVKPQSGDWIGKSAPVRPDASGVKIRIDQPVR